MTSFQPDIPWVFLIFAALVLAHVAGRAREARAYLEARELEAAA